MNCQVGFRVSGPGVKNIDGLDPGCYVWNDLVLNAKWPYISLYAMPSLVYGSPRMVHVDDPTMSPETQNPKSKSLNPKGPATKLSCSGLGDVDAVFIRTWRARMCRVQGNRSLPP